MNRGNPYFWPVHGKCLKYPVRMLLGRPGEQARVDALLADARTAISGVLVVRG